MAETVPSSGSAYVEDLPNSGENVESAVHDSPEMVTNLVVPGGSGSTDALPIANYEDGIIPVRLNDTLAIEVTRDGSNEDDDRFARENFEKLLVQMTAAQESARPSNFVNHVAFTEPDIPLRETLEESSGDQAQNDQLSPEDDGSHNAEFFGTRFHSAFAVVPKPTHKGQRAGKHTGANDSDLINSNRGVLCTFGLVKGGVYGGNNRLSFDSEFFDLTRGNQFQNSFNTYANSTTGMLFLTITDWQAWFLPHLQQTIPNFPADIVLHLSRTRATTMLPLLDGENRELSCVMEHIDISDEDTGSNSHALAVGAGEVRCLPIVVWTSAKELTNSALEYQSLVVVISTSNPNLSSRISNHYMQKYNERDRWNRLENNQIWIYLDLYFLFTRWDRVWGAIKQNLNARIEEVQGQRKNVSIIDQTRQLHIDNNVMISLREHLRIHKASLQVVIQRAKSWFNLMYSNPNILHTRLDDASRLLEFYDVTATSLLEQQQNLLSLAFDLETVIQGQAVARLNALAFIFLPLSLVATIFGITTFTAPPKWYPVAAAPVLILTIVIAWVAHKVLGSGPGYSNKRSRATVDVEKRSTKAAKTAEGGGGGNYRGRIWGQNDVVQRSPPLEARFDAPTSVNDPSRISKNLQHSASPPAMLQYLEPAEIPSEIQRVPIFAL